MKLAPVAARHPKAVHAMPVTKPNDRNRSLASQFVNECYNRGERRRILRKIGSRRIVDPEEPLPPIENIARLAIKFFVGTRLEPSGVFEMRTHELNREDANAKGESQRAKQQEQAVPVKHLS
jgi:hypothetical protein